MFSEECFLSKTTKKREIHEVDSGSSTASEPRSPTKVSQVRKRPRVPSVLISRNEETSPSASSVKKSTVGRHESPVWEIELEDGHLPSGSEDSRSGTIHGRAAPGDTVLMDTGVFAGKWRAKDLPTTPTQDVVDQTGRTLAEHHVVSPSIGPSHSASQVASRRRHFEAAGDWAADSFSKYFPAPPCPASGHLEPHPHDQGSEILPLEEQGLTRRITDTGHIDLPPQECSESIARGDSTLGSPSLPCARPVLSEECHYEQYPQSGPTWEVLAKAAQGESSHFAGGRPASPSSSFCLPPGPFSPAGSGIMDYRGLHPRGSDAGDVATWTVSPPLVEIQEQRPWMGQQYAQDHEYVMETTEEPGQPLQFLSDSADYAHESTGHLRDDLEVSATPDLDRGLEWHDGGQEPGSGYDHLSTFCTEQARYKAQDSDGSNDLYLTEGWYGEHVEDCAGMALDPSPVGDFEDDQPGDHGLAYSSEICIENQEQDPGMDDWDDSEEDENPTVLGSLPRFSQGRALLMGVSEAAGHGHSRGVSQIEEDVVRNLKSHWLPQRF